MYKNLNLREVQAYTSCNIAVTQKQKHSNAAHLYIVTKKKKIFEISNFTYMTQIHDLKGIRATCRLSIHYSLSNNSEALN